MKYTPMDCEEAQSEFWNRVVGRLCLCPADLERHRLLDAWLAHSDAKKGNCDDTVARRRAANCAAITRMLTEKRVPHVWIKGFVNESLCYARIGLRKYDDCDLLINRGSLSDTKRILRDSGYMAGEYFADRRRFVEFGRAEEVRRELFSHETVPLCRVLDPEEYYEVDINFYFGWLSKEEERAPLGTLTDRALETRVWRRLAELKLPTLNDRYLFAHTVLHFYNESMYFVRNKNWSTLGRPDTNLRGLYEAWCFAHRLTGEDLDEFTGERALLEPLGHFFALCERIGLQGALAVPPWCMDAVRDRRLDTFFDVEGQRISWRTPIERRLRASSFDAVGEVNELIQAHREVSE